MTNYRPDGFHTVTPALVVKGAKDALAHYESALGAVTGDVMEKDGIVIHAEFKIGDSWLFINDDAEWMPRRPMAGTQPTGLFLYVEDCDAAMKRALDAGMEEFFPLQDQFWGDRTGAVKDRYGYCWTFATKKEDLSPEEIEERAKAQGW